MVAVAATLDTVDTRRGLRWLGLGIMFLAGCVTGSTVRAYLIKPCPTLAPLQVKVTAAAMTLGDWVDLTEPAIKAGGGRCL